MLSEGGAGQIFYLTSELRRNLASEISADRHQMSQNIVMVEMVESMVVTDNRITDALEGRRQSIDNNIDDDNDSPSNNET